MDVSESKTDIKRELDDSGCVQDEPPPKKQRDDYIGQAQLLDLSDDVLLCILRFCSPHDLKALGFTCARLGSLVLERSLWTRVDARDVPYGVKRVNWLLQSVHEGTRQLLLCGLARDSKGCLGHVNRTRQEVESELIRRRQCRGAGDYIPCSEPTEEEDLEQVVAGFDPPLPPPASNRYRQHARLHIAHQLPRISTSPSWPDEPGIEPVAAPTSPPDSARDCSGPQFTLTARALRAIKETCPHLSEMSLDYCNINCRKTSISTFPKTLKKLSLKGSKCYNLPLDTSFLFKIHDHLPALEDLDLSECRWLEPAALLPLSKIPGLKTLLMRDCPGMSEFVAYVSLATRYGFRKLKLLDFRGSPVGDSEVSALGWLPELEELRLAAPVPRAGPDPIHRHYRGDRVAVYTELQDWETEEPEYYQSRERVDFESPDSSVEDVEDQEQLRQRLGHPDQICIEVHSREHIVVPQAMQNLQRQPEPRREAQGTLKREHEGTKPNSANENAKRKKTDDSGNEGKSTPDDSDKSAEGKSTDDATSNENEAGPSKRQKTEDGASTQSAKANESPKSEDENGPGPSKRQKTNETAGKSGESAQKGDAKGSRNDNAPGPSKRQNPNDILKVETVDVSQGFFEITFYEDDADPFNIGRTYDGPENGEAPGDGPQNGEAPNGEDPQNQNVVERPNERQNQQIVVTNTDKNGNEVRNELQVDINRNSQSVTISDRAEPINGDLNTEPTKKSDKDNETQNTDKSTSGAQSKNDSPSKNESSSKKDSDSAKHKNSNKKATTSELSQEPSSSKNENTSQNESASKKDSGKHENSNEKASSSDEPAPSSSKNDSPSKNESAPKKDGDSAKHRASSSSKKTKRASSSNEPPRYEIEFLDIGAQAHAELIPRSELKLRGKDTSGKDNPTKKDSSTNTVGPSNDNEANDSQVQRDSSFNTNRNPSQGHSLQINYSGPSTSGYSVNINFNNNNEQTFKRRSTEDKKDKEKKKKQATTQDANQEASQENARPENANSPNANLPNANPENANPPNANPENANPQNANAQNVNPPNPAAPAAPADVRCIPYRENPNPVVIQEPRHHVLYVNLGQQLHAVYRLLPNRPVYHSIRNRSYRTPSAERLNSSSLVTDSAIFRFGRADGEAVNIVNIGPNGPNMAGQEGSGRPNRSSLRTLIATGYRNITNRSLVHLTTAAPNLRFIDFTDSGVTDEGVATFLSLRPECQIRYSQIKIETDELEQIDD